MRKSLPIVVLIFFFALVAMVVWVSNQLDRKPPAKSKPSAKIETKPVVSMAATASESLLEGYADPSTPPQEDLKKIHRVAVGYFSVIKDSGRFPIGGNADFSAALQGENSNREIFVRRDHPVFSPEGLLLDRWGSPLMVHPEAWRQLEFRSAGPDRILFNGDDLILGPSGNLKGP